MRLAERNDLRESEGQQTTRYLEDLKQHIRHMIGVQVIRNLHEAKNMALRAEFVIQDQRRFDSPKRNYGSDNSGAPIDEGLTV